MINLFISLFFAVTPMCNHFDMLDDYMQNADVSFYEIRDSFCNDDIEQHVVFYLIGRNFAGTKICIASKATFIVSSQSINTFNPKILSIFKCE